MNEELVIALGEALADIKARLEVIENVIVKSGLISHDDLVAQTEKQYDACNPIKMAMDELYGHPEKKEET